MSKAKVKITVRKGKSNGNGMLLTKVPIRVEPNDNPTGERMYQTKAQVSVRIKTTKGGRPRVR